MSLEAAQTGIINRAGQYIEPSQNICDDFTADKITYCEYCNDFNAAFIWALRFLKTASLDWILSRLMTPEYESIKK